MKKGSEVRVALDKVGVTFVTRRMTWQVSGTPFDDCRERDSSATSFLSASRSAGGREVSFDDVDSVVVSESFWSVSSSQSNPRPNEVTPQLLTLDDL
jgi:hypothetical protein